MRAKIVTVLGAICPPDLIKANSRIPNYFKKRMSWCESEHVDTIPLKVIKSIRLTSKKKGGLNKCHDLKRKCMLES